MDALIRYVCRAPSHKPVAGARGDLTVYDRSWAFCPAEERDGHVWERVSAVTVPELTRYGLREPSTTTQP
ncbi:MAG TPA: hypothetical protein VFM93_09040 [Candidatus Limnocylindria bacterium]|nr:hypothetical protein [Candidatus Limnocylindria bacterium]